MKRHLRRLHSSLLSGVLLLLFILWISLYSMPVRAGNGPVPLAIAISTTTTLVSDINPSCVGSNILLTATVTPNLATGNVEFFDGATSLGISALSSGLATLNTSSLASGVHTLTAVYLGDGTYDASTSLDYSQTINAGIPAVPGTISGIATQCPSLTEQIYSIATVTDATTYNWALPTGWTITNGAGTETIAVTTGTTGQDGNITVTASNACGTSGAGSLAVTVGNAAPATPGAISGTSPICQGTSTSYSISAVANATGYTWGVPAGWNITAGSGTTSITVTIGTSSGNVTVTADNACGNSAVQTLPVTVTLIPATPGTITGTTPVCPSTTGLSYSIAPVAGATSYTWTFPSGWSITANPTTTNPTFTAGAAAVSGNINVAAVNACGSSAAPKTVFINPAIATNNTGYTDGSTKSSDGITTGTTAPERRGYLKFSLAGIPAGVTITASNLKITNSAGSSSSGGASYVKGLGGIDPIAGTAAAIFNAIGANATGTLYNTAVWSATGQLSLNLNATANTDITNSISSPGFIAMGLNRSTANLYNFYGYSGVGSNAPLLTLTYASVRSFAVTVNPATPVQPGAITGSSGVCPNTAGYTYSIAAVTNATGYTWTVPAGWNVTAGAGTTSITVTSGVAGGNISVTAGNSCGTSPARTLAVSINTVPTVSASPTSQNTCSGLAIGTITLNNPNNIPGGVTYAWVRDNTILTTGMAASGGGSNLINGSLTSPTGTQQQSVFTITATANGCTSAPVTSTVIVNPNPLANAGVDQEICAASSTTIGGSPAAALGTSPYSYLWTAGVSNTTIANPTAPPGTYTLTVTDSKGCKGTDAVTIASGTSTKNWIGSGTLGGGPDANFNNPLNWSPAGVPGSCNAVNINVDIYDVFNLFGGSVVISLASNATIKSLSIDIGGTVIFSSAANLRLHAASNTLSILNATTLNTHTNSVFSSPPSGLISVGTGGTVIYGGTLTTLTSNNCLNYPFYSANHNSGKMYVKGNAALAGIGNDVANKPAQVIFDAMGTQTISNNNTTTQSILLGATSTDVGETNSPTVILSGAGTGGFRSLGNLNVNTNATLDVAQQTINRNAAGGGTINLAAGSFMKLGRNSGGILTSNFPSNYSAYAFNATSTVDYNANAGQNVINAPLYGNLTLSTSGNKNPTGDVNVQRNVTIAGAAILTAGVNTISLGGNWTNYNQTGLLEQTSIVDFNGSGAQTINTTGGEIFYQLRKTGVGTTTMLSDVAVQGGGASAFTLSNGTFDAQTFSFNSASSALNQSAGLLKLARLATTLPEFAVASYNLTGGTIELYGTGNQVLRGARDYRNLTFSVSGTKTITSAINNITGTILIQNAAIVDVNNSNMGGAGTNLTMTGTSLYRTAGTGTKPDAAGVYTLGANTTVEFYNSSAATTEDIRLTAPTYYNLVVSGTNVANASAGTGIKFQAGGTFTVKNGAIFKLANTAGFTGSTTTSVSSNNNPSIVIEDGSTVEYYGGPAGTNVQAITTQYPYWSLNFSGTSIKNAPAGTVTVKGNLSNTGSGFAHNNGTFLLSGTLAQNYNSTGTTLTYYNLTATNPVNVNINGDLGVANLLSLGAAGKLNFNSGNLSLKSTAAGTASIDKINTINSLSYTGAGRFIVERYIPTGAGHAKSWQFLSAPAFGQSLNATWQEGNAPLVVGTTGLGTTITSEKPGAVGRGYDFYTPGGGPSLKTYDTASNSWKGVDDGVTATNALQLNNKKGYLLFVRGDRSIQSSATPANVTTLRTTGKLYAPGMDAPPTSTLLANKLESVANPYASALDFNNLVSTSSGIDAKYYVWDPFLPGANGYGYGGYQLLSSSNLWIPIPGGTINYPAATPYSKIQSGQAFFVYSTPGGTVSFAESNKVTGSQQVYRQQDAGNRQFIRTTLYGESGNLADGNAVAFDESFSNAFDQDDAIKIGQSNENFSIASNDKILALDARPPVVETDTIQYLFSGQHVQGYQLKVTPVNFGHTNLVAFFNDRYRNSSMPLDLQEENTISITVDSEAASAAPDRFFITFKALRPVPVKFVHLSAQRVADKVEVDWKVENELNISRYEVERSANGRTFQNISNKAPENNNGGASEYGSIDGAPFAANNFYRIKAVEYDGSYQYSNIVKVGGLETITGIAVYPNPVREKTINVHFYNQPPGYYPVQLLNSRGQIVYRGSLTVGEGIDAVKIALRSNIRRGNYRLVVFSPSGKQTEQQILID